MKRITLSSLAVALSLGVFPAWSAVEYIEVQTAPPAPLVEERRYLASHVD